MRYVSDSKKDKKGRKVRPNLPNVKPNRVAPPIPEPIITERDGVKVNISSAIKNAHKANKPPKEPMDSERIHAIVIRVLIGVAIAAGIAAVMFIVYFFALNNSGEQSGIEEIEGYPALVGGINIETTPVAVASLSPLLTDLCETLPIGNSLAAVSEYCNNPNELPTVGTPLLPDIDSIIELDAEYLLTITPLTTKQKISLEQTGTKVLEFEMPTTISGFSDLASEIATLFLGKEDGPQIGSGIYGRMSNSLSLYSAAVNNVTDDRPTYALMFDLSGYTATSETVEAQIFSSILGPVAVAGQGYATTLEQVAAADPEVLILPNTLTMEDLIDTGLENSTAAQNSNIFFIDMSDIETFKPTLLFEVAKIAAKVYPDLQL